MALSDLVLSRTYLLETALSSPTPDLLKLAHQHLDQAITGFRKSSYQEWQCLGFITKVQLHRFQLQHTKDSEAQAHLEQAQSNLWDANEIALRGPLPLYQADIHLEHTRLHLAQGQIAQACKHLVKARGLVNEHGYGRRDSELKVVEELLMHD